MVGLWGYNDMIPALLAAAVGRGGVGVITLSGETASDSVADPSDATASLRFDTDGNVYKIEGAVQTQVDTATDYIRPTANADRLQIRFTNLVGTALTSSTAAEDVWHAISGGDFTLTQTRTTVGFSASSFDVQLRVGTGPVRASGAYVLNAEVT